MQKVDLQRGYKSNTTVEYEHVGKQEFVPLLWGLICSLHQ